MHNQSIVISVINQLTVKCWHPYWDTNIAQKNVNVCNVFSYTLSIKSFRTSFKVLKRKYLSSSSSLRCEVLPQSHTFTRLRSTTQVRLHSGMSLDSWMTSTQEANVSLYLTPSQLVRVDTNIACRCHSTRDSWMDTEGKFGSVSRSSLSASYNGKKKTSKSNALGGKTTRNNSIHQ